MQNLRNRIPQIARHGVRDLLLQLLHEIGAIGQHGGDGCHREHEDGEDSQNREIRNSGRELVSALAAVAVQHLHDVVDKTGLLADFIYRARLIGISTLDAVVIGLLLIGLSRWRHRLSPFYELQK